MRTEPTRTLPHFDALIVLAAAVCDGTDHRVPSGARCPLIAVLDLDRLAALGLLDRYGDGDDGLDIGWMLHDALRPLGWNDVTIDDVTPAGPALAAGALEPETRNALARAAKDGIAHIVFAPLAEATRLN